MLKIKEQFHYRRGLTNRKCSLCLYYVDNFKRTSFNGADLGEEPRCHMIGLNLGRMYRVQPTSVCDKFEGKE